MNEGLYRMIDANANRSREGLRVLEDIARFVLADSDAARACKDMRHALTDVMKPLGFELLAARDTASDVGTQTTAPAESTRAGPRELAAAEASRVGEALRVLEESCKVLQSTDAPLAGGATAQRASDFARASSTCKQLRYKAYDITRDIVLALERNKLSSQPGGIGTWQPTLCVLLTSELCMHMSWQEVARAAIAGGADCLQLREKNLDARELLSRAKELVQLAAATPAVRVIINDRIDIALASGADGVHLGQNDLPAGDARAIATSAGRGRTAAHRLLIGVSTFSASDARDAAAAGADICGVGPMFPTTTKDKPKIAGPAALHRYLLDEATKHVPHLAIGGIQASNVQELRAVGCRGIAVSSVVCNAREPSRVCEQLLIGLRN